MLENIHVGKHEQRSATSLAMAAECKSRKKDSFDHDRNTETSIETYSSCPCTVHHLSSSKPYTTVHFDLKDGTIWQEPYQSSSPGAQERGKGLAKLDDGFVTLPSCSNRRRVLNRPDSTSSEILLHLLASL